MYQVLWILFLHEFFRYNVDGDAYVLTSIRRHVRIIFLIHEHVLDYRVRDDTVIIYRKMFKSDLRVLPFKGLWNWFKAAIMYKLCASFILAQMSHTDHTYFYFKPSDI